MKELSLEQVQSVAGGVDDSVTVAGLTVTGIRAGLALGAVGAALTASASVGWAIGSGIAQFTDADEWLSEFAWELLN